MDLAGQLASRADNARLDALAVLGGLLAQARDSGYTKGQGLSGTGLCDTNDILEGEQVWPCTGLNGCGRGEVLEGRALVLGDRQVLERSERTERLLGIDCDHLVGKEGIDGRLRERSELGVLDVSRRCGSGSLLDDRLRASLGRLAGLLRSLLSSLSGLLLGLCSSVDIARGVCDAGSGLLRSRSLLGLFLRALQCLLLLLLGLLSGGVDDIRFGGLGVLLHLVLHLLLLVLGNILAGPLFGADGRELLLLRLLSRLLLLHGSVGISDVLVESLSHFCVGK